MSIDYIIDIIVIMFVPLILLGWIVTDYLTNTYLPHRYYSLPLKINQVNYIDFDVNAVRIAHTALLASVELLNQQLTNINNLIIQANLDIDTLRSKIAIVIAGRTP